MRFSRVSSTERRLATALSAADDKMKRPAQAWKHRRWLWDGVFCGNILLGWASGTEALPPHGLGHIGYAVVPWKRRRGYATRALGEMLQEARAAVPSPCRNHHAARQDGRPSA